MLLGKVCDGSGDIWD